MFGLIVLFIIFAPLVALMELLLFWMDYRAAKQEEQEDLEDDRFCD
jgi:hypothetical protein